MEIKSKNDIIDYFASGIKQDELIGVENEQFLFNIKTVSYTHLTLPTKA